MKRFFCENCGVEVPETSDVCPECGAFFVAIKCPRCGYRGKPHEFRRGCPHCGYLAEEAHTTEEIDQPRTGRTPRRFVWWTHRSSSRDYRERKRPPRWVFWVVLGVLASSFVALSRLYVAL